MQPAVNHFPITLLFLLSLDFRCTRCLLHEERPLNELKSFIDDTTMIVSKNA